MRKSSIYFILLWLNTPPFFLCAAKEPFLRSFEDYVEQIYQLQNFTEEEDWESIKEKLQEAYAAPLDLNKVSKEELTELGILSDKQIKNFFEHLSFTGPLYSKYELQAIPDFDLLTITLLLPFIYVQETYTPTFPFSVKEANTSNNNYFLIRYQPSFGSNGSYQKGRTRKSPFLGGLDQYMLQLSFTPRNYLAIGITARKQKGESFCWDHSTNRYGFNVWSIFMIVENKKIFQKIIIGDYQLGYGQGLLLGAGYTKTQGKNGILSIIRNHTVGIRPYKGSKRIGFRGIALTSNIGPMELTSFYANNKLDAKINKDHNFFYTNTIDRTGTYDTLKKLEKRRTLQEHVIGCTLRTLYNRKQVEIGINLLYNGYDTPIIPKKSIYSSYLFHGKWHASTSLFYRMLWKNLLFFGEGGIVFFDKCLLQQDPEKAFVTGCLISLSRYVDCSGALYYYGKGFFAPYGNGFKQYTTDLSNEKGSVGGIKFTPFTCWQLSTTGHFFSTLRPAPRLSEPCNGYSITTQSNHTFKRNTLWTIRHRFTNKPKNPSRKKHDSIDKNEVHIGSSKKNNFKLKIDHKFTHTWWSSLEAQYTYHFLLNQSHKGYALSATQKWKRRIFQFICKMTYFDTDENAPKFYFHEPNPLYNGITFMPYYGHGIATSWLLCWKPIPWFRFELKHRFIYHLKELIFLTKNHRAHNKNRHMFIIQCIATF